MNKNEFARRRKTLMRMVGEDGIAILPSAPVKIRNRDVEYRFRQDSDFYYLSGFAEPDAVAVLAPGRDNGEWFRRYLVSLRFPTSVGMAPQRTWF